jgi:hypothetical protein
MRTNLERSERGTSAYGSALPRGRSYPQIVLVNLHPAAIQKVITAV